MENYVDSLVNAYRTKTASDLGNAGLAAPKGFQNPEPGQSVRAADFLHHLDINTPGINAILRRAHPGLDTRPGLRAEIQARIRALAWMTLRNHAELASGYRELEHDLGAQTLLGFQRHFPSYETFRRLLHHRLGNGLFQRLLDELVQEEHRLCPTLGQHQVEDAIVLEARRRDTEAPFHPKYEIRMHKLEARFDTTHEALLTTQFYHGLASETHFLEPLTDRLHGLGIHGKSLTVDGGYTSFHHIAYQWRIGQPLNFRAQEGWNINPETAWNDVNRRYQTHWRHREYRANATPDEKLRFLIDHGTLLDVDACGKYLRDRFLREKTPDQEAEYRLDRSGNEALNGVFKELPIAPASCGSRELLRRANLCALTTHLVQLTRLQHGITTGLCRTTHIL